MFKLICEEDFRETKFFIRIYKFCSAYFKETYLNNFYRKSNETLFDWIEKHCKARLSTPSFIRVLTTVVIESVIDGIGGPTYQCKLNEEQLRMRNPVLKKYLDGKPKLEMQALLALQYLMHR